jgi:hypothetical protein
VFSFNEHEIDAARRYCDQIGITFNRRDAFIQNPDWLPSYRQNEAEQLRNPSPPQPAPADSMANRPPRPCAWHYSYSAINANGSVSACCATYNESLDFGLLQPGTVSFRDVWNNNLYRKARGVFANKPVPGLENVENLCLHCTFGPDVKYTYAYLDPDVSEQFHRIFGYDDPLLNDGFHQLSDPPGFTEYFTRHMGEFYALEHDLGISQPATHSAIESRPNFTPTSIKFYQNLKDKLKPYTAMLFKRFPSLYTKGKTVEKRIIRH